MYVPPHNRQTDDEAVLAFLRGHPFATLVTCGPAGLAATHIPVNSDYRGGAFRLSGHIARANAQVGDLENGAEAMVIFSEPHGYVSPSNYDAGQSVPTWNYIAVHAYGPPRLLHEREAKMAVLTASIGANDPAYQAIFDGYDASYVDAKLKGIVAFEILVTRVDARWKLSQDRTAGERERVSLALKLSADPSAQRLGEYMDQAASAGSR